MPKMKTNSSVKKRFKISSSGKVRFYPAGKRHGMRKRSQSMIRKARGPQTMKDCDAGLILKIMPYAKKK